jgi:hypothetical protein
MLTVTDTQGRSAKGVGRHQVVWAPQKTLIFRLLGTISVRLFG